MSRGGLADDLKVEARVDSIIRDVETRHDTAGARKVAAALEKVMKLVEMDIGLGDRLAMAENVKSVFGARSSDRELELVLRGGGRISVIENWINEWASGGELSESFTDQMLASAQETRGLVKKRMLDIGLHAARRVKRGVQRAVGREGAEYWGEYAYGAITGEWGDEAEPPAEEGDFNPRGLPDLKPSGPTPSAADIAKKHGGAVVK